jgi:hypothetical protein
MRAVLIVEADERLLSERAEQLLMDGYAVDAVSAFEPARIKLAERPDALVLCNAGSAPATIALLRRLRAGEIARADPALPCWPSAPMMTRRRCATTAPASTSRCPHTAPRSSSRQGSSRSPAASLASSAARSCGWGA